MVLFVLVVLVMLGCDGLFLASWEDGVNPAYATQTPQQIRDGERMERLWKQLEGGQ